ncbi:hypothetical protein BDZ94DRAFT_1315169 [Collybia nuda]|uniref:RNase H type-1 domain-containing protein n=1 Tax=Collybia nuda TaxID=64659 RepID=A0A9P6CBU8_9AGAR|nr:hypothetical protein BDZ94DRAFT_1315169 [Collybia nuda]
MTITIAEMREEAVEEDEKNRTNVKVYTDGSETGGKISAAAVLYRGGRMTSILRCRLGSAKCHTVYEGECIGALMGLKLIEREENIHAATFGIDNHAAITSTNSIRPATGHYILDKIHNEYHNSRTIHNLRLQINIQWTPGHEGIAGNEKADEEAKEAATKGSSDKRHLPEMLQTQLPWRKLAVKQAYMVKLKTAAKKVWTTSKHYKKLKQTDPSHHQKNTMT